MSEKHNYIREWRKHRGLSLARLAGRMESSPGEEFISAMSLSRIERGLQGYNEEILVALSIALDCEPHELISVNPLVDGDVIDLMRIIKNMDVEKREQARKILSAINE